MNATSVTLHPQAICESARVGSGTRVWAFAHILPGAVLGSDCNICDHVFVENDVTVGDRVTIKSGVQLWDGVRLEDDVFIGPNVTFTNDPFPRSRQHQTAIPITTICRGASIGANATILPGLTIGPNAMVGAGSVVTRDVPTNAIVYGNPARIRGYVDATAPSKDPQTAVRTTRDLPGDARIIELASAVDARGSLVALEMADAGLPFEPKRFFAVFGVPSVDVRGEHAHRQCHQLLVAMAGSLVALVDDGTSRQEVLLDNPSTALYLPSMTWGSQFQYSQDAVLAVFASHRYDADDYIRDYQEFVDLKRA